MPAPQMLRPSAHILPDPAGLSQPPQWRLSELISTQVPPQSRSFGGQENVVLPPSRATASGGLADGEGFASINNAEHALSHAALISKNVGKRSKRGIRAVYQ